METQTQMIFSFFNLPSFFTFFIIIYMISYFIIFKSWTPKTRPEASSCIISLFHSTPAVVFSLYAVLSAADPSFSSANTVVQSAVLDYSIAYFLTDLIHYLIFYPSDVLFIGHHLATLFVFVTCRYVTFHGACAILGLLILAEVTSACQNAWTLAGLRKDDVEFAQKVFDVLSLPFYAFYSVIRGFSGPYYVYKMTSFYVGAGEELPIPKWAWMSWIVVVLTAIGVSILWVSNLWVEFFKRSGKLEKHKL
ncbi:TLC domain-containing protein At5g14285-like [Rutidosis leptorrhynchoides]|uniref:TLC domain-containing protein At5g14285-like n=1 Tax=Rutidosis leptorrhynchoides TaxID=125765 RepID=UPI003A9999F7